MYKLENSPPGNETRLSETFGTTTESESKIEVASCLTKPTGASVEKYKIYNKIN